ncbi:hypothetical protein [Nocardioides abyssi]|uniref:Uncharacterized protein n=1 Tax=Nocardioides abyssi TaxID=3058370 RepID=A0ABT8ESL5_9ACTN|nr:hypothetical protein [Nocardioides abyssi]MDN4161140.1 hypothetical protein [Nocardioides abyssi]
MKPLQSVAMGLLVVGLTASFGEYDALPDPLGWVLVLVGLLRLPTGTARRPVLVALAALAGVVAVPLWVPSVAEALEDVDASVAWALTLPQLVCMGLLCHVLAIRATGAGDLAGARRLRLAVTLVVVVAALPVLVLGAGVESLATPAAVLAVATLVLVVWQLFTLSGRAWATDEPPPDRSGRSAAADRSGP